MGTTAFLSKDEHDNNVSEKPAAQVEGDRYFWKIVHHIPPETIEITLKNYKENLLWLFISLSLIVGFVSWTFATVMTRRRISIRELIESEERFKALHDASFGGILIHGQAFIIDCN